MVGRPDFDFDRPETLRAALDAARPSLVVNAAAYTAVDAAETEPDAAWRANRDGPAALAAWCAERGVPLIHISTDYVFDGLKGAPYVETIRPARPASMAPASWPARRRCWPPARAAIVLRTSWVYAATGKNFVLTMLNAARTNRPAAGGRRPARLPDRRRRPRRRHPGAGRSPGTAATFAACCTPPAAARRPGTGWRRRCSRAAARHGLRRPAVEAIATADWPTPARRPPDSRLDCGRLARRFGLALPHWEEGVARVVDAAMA